MATIGTPAQRMARLDSEERHLGLEVVDAVGRQMVLRRRQMLKMLGNQCDKNDMNQIIRKWNQSTAKRERKEKGGDAVHSRHRSARQSRLTLDHEDHYNEHEQQ
jgi:hypothetical protein